MGVVVQTSTEYCRATFSYLEI